MATLEVAVDPSKAESGARRVNKAFDDMQRGARTVGGSAQFMGKSFDIARLSLVGATAAGVAFVGVFATKYISLSAQLAKQNVAVASSAEEIQSKFNAVFKDQAPQVLAELGELGDEVGRSTIKLSEYAATLQDTFVPMGIARDRAADFSTQLVQLAVDVASFNNRADADVIRDFQSALVGNTETVRKYGIVITEANTKIEAYESGIANVGDELDEQQKIQARLNLILRGTTDAQGDAIRTADSWANSTKRLKDEIFDLRKEMGDQLIIALQDAIEDFGGMDAVVASVGVTFQSMTTFARESINILGEVGAVMSELGLTADNLISITKFVKNVELERFFLSVVQSGNLAAGTFLEFQQAMAGTLQEMRDELLLAKAAEGQRDPFAGLVPDPDLLDKVARKSEFLAAAIIGVRAAFRSPSPQTLAKELAELADAQEELQRGNFAAEQRALMDDLNLSYSEQVDVLEEDAHALRLYFENMRRANEISDDQAATLQDLVTRWLNEKDALLANAEAHDKAAKEADKHADAMDRLQAQLAAEDIANDFRFNTFLRENGLLLQTGRAALGEFSGALADTSVGFGELEANAKGALKNILRDMLNATTQAILLKNVLRPFLTGPLGLDADLVDRFFGISGGGARGFMQSPGRTEFFALGGGFPVGMIDRPTSFRIPGGVGIAGEGGMKEFGFEGSGNRVIAPLGKTPEGRIGVEVVGGAGARPIQINMTNHFGPGSDASSIRLAQRHMERDLRDTARSVFGAMAN